MRLLLVIPNIVSYRAFLGELCASLCATGVEVHVACSPDSLWASSATAGEKGVQFHAINFARGMHPAQHSSAARALRRLVRKLRPHLVHAHFSAAIFATALARTWRWPVTLATFHGVGFLAMDGWKAKLIGAVECWAARRFDRVWVLTDSDRDGLRAVTRPDAVQTLGACGVGCDLARFAPVSANVRAAQRSELGFRRENCVFAFVGRFVDFKGFGLAARAFLRLADDQPTARLLLVGARDPLHPSGLTPAEEEELTDSPQVIETGMRPDVERFLAAADVLVFPSQREGMPVCIMEALAMGVPVITRDARGCRDVVRDGVDGLVLRDCSVENLSSAMQWLAEEGDLRRQFGANALAGRDRFDRAHFIREQTRLYESFASGAAAPAAAANLTTVCV